MPKNKPADINEALANLLLERATITEERARLNSKEARLNDRIAFLKELGAKVPLAVPKIEKKEISQGAPKNATLPAAIIHAIKTDAGKIGLTPKNIRWLLLHGGNYKPINIKKFPDYVGATLKRLREESRIRGEMKGNTWYYFPAAETTEV